MSNIIVFIPLILVLVALTGYVVVTHFRKLLNIDVASKDYFTVKREVKWFAFDNTYYNAVKDWYSSIFIKHSDLTFSLVLFIKVMVILLLFALFVAVRLTDASQEEHRAFNDYYLLDGSSFELNGEPLNETMIQHNLDLEIEIVGIILDEEDMTLLQNDLLLFRAKIYDYVTKYNFLSVIDEFTVSNIQRRVELYVGSGKVFYFQYFIISILLSLVVELAVFIYDQYYYQSMLQELRFMKQQIVLMEDEKGGNFKDMVVMLKKRAKRYKGLFIEIERSMQRNGKDPAEVLAKLEYEKNLTLKYFYEDLITATYSMDEAIADIKDSAVGDEEEFKRRIKRREAILESIGIIFSLLVFASSIYYVMTYFFDQYNFDVLNML